MTEYTTKVLFMHKNKHKAAADGKEEVEEGKYLFIFNDDEKTLGNGVKSLLMNASDVRDLLDASAEVAETGKSRYAKVSVMTN